MTAFLEVWPTIFNYDKENFIKAIRCQLFCTFLIFASVLPSPAYDRNRGVEVPGLFAYQGHVSAAWHGGALHVVTTDKNQKVVYTRRVDGQWIAPIKLAYHRSSLVPDLAVCDGTLHMAGSRNFKIWHSIWDDRA